MGRSSDCPISLKDASSIAGPAVNLDKQAGCFGKYAASGIENPALGPMLAALAAQPVALQANRRRGVNRAQITDFHLCGYSRQPLGPHRFAHRLVEHCGNDAAMYITVRTLESFQNRRQANHFSVFGKQKLQMQSSGIGRSATETAALGVMHHGG